MSDFHTRPLTADDYADWRALFNGYAEFYGTAMTDATAAAVWEWLLDPAHELEGWLVTAGDGCVLGLAHIRRCPRPLAGCDMGWLDDMFVYPDARGSGAADALFARLRMLAAERGWPVIRWVTQHFNARGRAFYDRYTSGPSDFIMYQWKPE